MTTTIAGGEQIPKDPSDKKVITLNWEDLPEGAELTGVGTITVTAVEPREVSPTLEYDQVSLVTGNRNVKVRVIGGRRGTLYNIAHHITTNETPAQELERSFLVMVEDQ